MTYGILNIYKEKGFTSHDVVAVLRRKLHMKKIGHTGTLDPEAEGVLPICLGKATKAVDFLTNKDKTYVATMTLGVETDTQDHTGAVVSMSPVSVSEEEILKAIQGFIGEYDQTPPMYSALKQNGKRLYELAREGKTVERKSRRVIIHSIDNIHIDGPNASFEVSCSKGTYIRTLCHDVGALLGCGGHMTSLRRTKVGNFMIEESITLAQIDEYVTSNSIDKIITPTDVLFNQYDKIIIDENYNKYLYNGNKLSFEYIKVIEGDLSHDVFRVYDEEMMFIGLYSPKIENETKLLKPIKIFI